MTERISRLEKEFEAELSRILLFWETRAVDREFGGFYGAIDGHGRLVDHASKGVILNTRILWTFAYAGVHYADDRFFEICERSYSYLKQFFWDDLHLGFFWELDHQGRVLNDRKQTYAQAFGVYALAQYYQYSKVSEAKDLALKLFELLELHALDSEEGGYIEAFARDWSPIKDMRLSHKDLNAPKTANTHLHVLEAYTSLYSVTREEKVKVALLRLLKLFRDYFFRGSLHLRLFFTHRWEERGEEISFGHDIEAVWLLLEAAESTGVREEIDYWKNQLVRVADQFIRVGIAADFGVLNAMEIASGALDSDRHWWPQAEAMVGLHYAYGQTKEDKYLDVLEGIWEYTKSHIIDKNLGEWRFRVNEAGVPYSSENLLGPWKCPYHNGRAMMVLLQRIRQNNTDR